MEDVGVVANVDERWWKEAEGSMVKRWWRSMLMWHAFGRGGNGEPSGTTFLFGCASMTKLSMPSFRVYKPLLFMFFPLGMSQYYFILVIITFHYNLLISVIVGRPRSVRTSLNQF